MKQLSLLVSFCFVLGCSSNNLVKDLYSTGINPSTTEKLVFIGSEADYGFDTKVTITDGKVIDAVWSSIINSKNYGRYSFCGYSTIEFYSSDDLINPKAKLRVMCGGLEHGSPTYFEGKEPSEWNSLKGGRDGLYECKGLDELIMEHLKEEYAKRNI